MKSAVRVGVSMLVLVCLESRSLAGIIFSDSFDSPSGWVTMPNEANTTSDFNYWYTDQPDIRFIGGALDTLSTTCNGQASRNLRTGGELASNQFFTSPTLQANEEMRWGGDGMYWLKFNVAFLDQNNCGYLAEATRSEEIAIYRVDNGVLTGIGGNSNGPTGNGRTLTLAKNGSTITFTSTLNGGASGAVTVSDGTYTNFTKIGIGGTYAGGERILINDVALNATIVPEPLTTLILGLGAAGIIRRK